MSLICCFSTSSDDNWRLHRKASTYFMKSNSIKYLKHWKHQPKLLDKKTCFVEDFFLKNLKKLNSGCVQTAVNHVILLTPCWIIFNTHSCIWWWWCAKLIFAVITWRYFFMCVWMYYEWYCSYQNKSSIFVSIVFLSLLVSQSWWWDLSH